jgi:hypothetical protein
MTTSESLVDVSPSTVTRLKEPSASSRQQLLHQEGDTGIGGDESEHGGHVGADHAGALADAGDVTVLPPISRGH